MRSVFSARKIPPRWRTHGRPATSIGVVSMTNGFDNTKDCVVEMDVDPPPNHGFEGPGLRTVTSAFRHATITGASHLPGMPVQVDALTTHTRRSMRGVGSMLTRDPVDCRCGIVRHAVRRLRGGVNGWRRTEHRERRFLPSRAQSRVAGTHQADWVACGGRPRGIEVRLPPQLGLVNEG